MKQASEARPLFDYLRVLLGCIAYLGIDPLLKLIFGFVPDEWGFLLSSIAVALSAALSWLVFNVVDSRSTFTFTWMDAAEGNSFAGEVIDLPGHTSDGGRIVYVRVERLSPTAVSRRVFGWLLSKNLVLQFSVNQTELRFVEERANSAITIHRNSVIVEMGMPDHDSNVVTFDLGLRWDGVLAPELVAKLKYEPRFAGGWWVKMWVALLIKISPAVKAFRKVQVVV